MPFPKNFQAIDPPTQALRERLRVPGGADWLVQRCFKIADLSGNIVPFKYNWTQQNVADELAEDERNGRMIRKFYLKRRRVGLSAMVSARMFAKVLIWDNRRAGVLAHDEDRASEILNNSRFYYDHLPDEFKFPKSRDSTTGLKIQEFNSGIIVGTAENPRKIRGDGLHDFHGSEPPYWRQFRKVHKEINPVVPTEPWTSIIYEGTGELRGGEAHQFYEECKAGKKGYSARFLNWRDDPTAVIRLPGDRDYDRLFAEIQNLAPDFVDKNIFYELSREQIVWAWDRFHNHCDDDLNYFATEYPYTEDEAWTVHGISYFGDKNLRALKPSNQQQTFIWKDRSMKSPFTTPHDLHMVEHCGAYERPFVRMWATPKPGRKYVIASDTSVGGRNSNYSCGYVIDQVTREMMCMFHGRMRYDEHAVILACLGRYYNMAIVAPEINNSGLAVVGELRKYYQNIFVWRKEDSNDYRETQHLGWQTNQTTRPMMLGELLKFVEDVAQNRLADVGFFKDMHLLDEMRTFCELPGTGRPEAVSGSQDDRVMALAIAHRVCHFETYNTSGDVYTDYDTVVEKIKRLEDDPLGRLLGEQDDYDPSKSAVDRVSHMLSYQTEMVINQQGRMTWENQPQ